MRLSAVLPGPRCRALLSVVLWVVGASAVRADPQQDVRNALRTLGQTSYSWETTVRQRTGGDAGAKLAPNAAIEVTGRTDPNGNTEVTLRPSRQSIEVPVMAVFKFGDAVGQTPLGWLRRTEIRESPGPDRPMDFEGKKVRLSKAFAAALRAMSVQTPMEEALDLIADVKSFREEGGLVIGDLRDAVIEKLWADQKAQSAPELTGNIIFKLSDGVLSEYHLLIGIGFPSSKTRAVNWSMMQWTTRIRDVGTTVVDPPAGAVEKLKD